MADGGACLIAESVETAEQLDSCARWTIAFGQGYLLGAPQPTPGEQLVQTAFRSTAGHAVHAGNGSVLLLGSPRVEQRVALVGRHRPVGDAGLQ